MKSYLLLLAIILFAADVPSFAQVPYNSAVPNGYTKKAMVSEQVGLTQVTITYHRPAVKGREGKVWGGLVPKALSIRDSETASPRRGAPGRTKIPSLSLKRTSKSKVKLCRKENTRYSSLMIRWKASLFSPKGRTPGDHFFTMKKKTRCASR